MSEALLEQGDKKRDLAWQRFRKCLLDGTLRAGTTLTQNKLASILGISMTPLRELLVLLEDCQLLEVKQRTGITITYPDLAFIRENLQFRSILEFGAIDTFCLKVDQVWVDDQIELHNAIKADLAKAAPGPNQHSSETFDQPFHKALVDSLENETISRTFGRIMDNVTLAQLVHRKTYRADQITDTLNEHLVILDRINARDATGAKAALRSHFKFSTHRIIGG